MYDIHRTTDGKEIMICYLTDEHLLNCLRAFVKAMTKAKEILAIPDDQANVFIEIHSHPSNSLRTAKEKAKQKLLYLSRTIQPYFLEGMIRDSINEEATTMLQYIYDRQSAMVQRSDYLEYLKPEKQSQKALKAEIQRYSQTVDDDNDFVECWQDSEKY